MPYWHLFYHVVWSTKNCEPLLTSDVEPMIFGFLKSKAIGLEGKVFAINGTEDHVHLVVSIPPKIAVATFIGQVKGVAATRFNKSGVRDLPLFWQNEYGVFSFDYKRLPNLVSYVERQKEHHAHDKIIPVLERTDDQGVRILHEIESNYVINDGVWWQEMMSLKLDSSSVAP